MREGPGSFDETASESTTFSSVSMVLGGAAAPLS